MSGKRPATTFFVFRGVDEFAEKVRLHSLTVFQLAHHASVTP